MPDTKALETFATPAPTSGGTGGPIVIEHIAEEFTSLCPKTGHPDFGVITLRYQPAAAGSADGKHACVELKSLKVYYQSFRNEGIFYEAVTGRIRDDLVAAMRPVWLQVIADWRGRGGIRSTIRADYGTVPHQFLGR